ncbi:Alpha-D-kanosaminyltransferase [Polystyrenella longa]|uniref:Alpha-D-kanosaminyltransferase n=1 Tax=Polystyrenella longa TaxID=2528007 RepID=A0A518CGS0_9PLAN|nr:glycosyltransferase family 4 protein [Polystyrenella longa]QDU78425.1 Alpha-D-kanosaminyltransferase [Polystyrenella longa]
MPDQMRVLLLAQRFELRGRSRYTMRLCNAFTQKDIQFEVITPEAHLLSAEDIDRWHISEYRHLDLPIWGRIVQRLIERDLLDSPPDLIHVQSGSLADFGLNLADALNRPAILTIQKHLIGNEPWLRHVNRFDRVITVSQDVKRSFLKHVKYPSNCLARIHNGVPIPELNLETDLLNPTRVPVIGIVGPLEKVKGIPYFLGAAKQLVDDKYDVEFIIAGAGPEETNLRRLTKELNLTQHVTFATNLRDLSAPLKAIDIYCLPSLQQGLGTIMLEAMSMGRLVIASNVGGVDSIVRDGETGWIVPAADSQALAKKFIDALDHPDISRTIGLAGRAFVKQKFSVEPMVEKTLSLYHQVVESRADLPSSSS